MALVDMVNAVSVPPFFGFLCELYPLREYDTDLVADNSFGA